MSNVLVSLALSAGLMFGSYVPAQRVSSVYHVEYRPITQIPAEGMSQDYMERNYMRLPPYGYPFQRENRCRMSPLELTIIIETREEKVEAPKPKAPGKPGVVKHYGPGDYRKDPYYCGEKNGVPRFSDDCKRPR